MNNWDMGTKSNMGGGKLFYHSCWPLHCLKMLPISERRAPLPVFYLFGLSYFLHSLLPRFLPLVFPSSLLPFFIFSFNLRYIKVWLSRLTHMYSLATFSIHLLFRNPPSSFFVLHLSLLYLHPSSPFILSPSLQPLFDHQSLRPHHSIPT